MPAAPAPIAAAAELGLTAGDVLTRAILFAHGTMVATNGVATETVVFEPFMRPRRPEHVAGDRQHGAVHHPQHRRGGLPRRPRPGEIVRGLHIDLDRPRGGDTHSDPKYTEYTREIRHIFEQQGVLSAR